MTAILTGMGRYLLVLLICLSLVFSDVEHLFMSLLTICMCSSKECLFRSSSLFKIKFVLVFCLFVCFVLSCLSTLDINSLLIISLANIFFHSVYCILILLMIYFAVQKLLSLIRPRLSIYAFVSFALGDSSKSIVMIYVKQCSAYVFS